MKLSILDLATIYNDETPHETLQNSTELVQLADKLGYTRYWFAEHHNTQFQMSTSPDILSAHAAALTKNIRIGSGGIMIPNHSPLHVVKFLPARSSTSRKNRFRNGKGSRNRRFNKCCVKKLK